MGLRRSGQRSNPVYVDSPDMTTPAWTRTDLTGDVAEPFRSDRDFWSSVSASADALLTMVLAAAAAVALALTVGPMWSPLPFIAPFVLLVRAGLSGRASAQRSREAFPGTQQWRQAERQAVAKVFGRALLRRRTPTG
jgi:hypothetical protein